MQLQFHPEADLVSLAENLLSGRTELFTEARKRLVTRQPARPQVHNRLVRGRRTSGLEQFQQALVAGPGRGAIGLFRPPELAHLRHQVFGGTLGQGGVATGATTEAVDQVLSGRPLHEVAARPATQHLDHRGTVGGGRIGQHAGPGRNLPDTEGSGEAAPTRHHDVQQSDVGPALGGLQYGCVGVAHSRDAYQVRGVFEEFHQVPAGGRGVVGHQHGVRAPLRSRFVNVAALALPVHDHGR